MGTRSSPTKSAAARRPGTPWSRTLPKGDQAEAANSGASLLLLLAHLSRLFAHTHWGPIRRVGLLGPPETPANLPGAPAAARPSTGTDCAVANAHRRNASLTPSPAWRLRGECGRVRFAVTLCQGERCGLTLAVQTWRPGGTASAAASAGGPGRTREDLCHLVRQVASDAPPDAREPGRPATPDPSRSGPWPTAAGPGLPAVPVRGGAAPVAPRVCVNRRAARVVQAMLDYVNEHYRHPMALSEVADHLRMNANYLSGLFRQTTGVGFHQHLEELRLSRAKELLADCRARIGEVACAVGYASPNHFRSVFNAREGLSPSDWRATHRPPTGVGANGRPGREPSAKC